MASPILGTPGFKSLLPTKAAKQLPLGGASKLTRKWVLLQQPYFSNEKISQVIFFPTIPRCQSQFGSHLNHLVVLWTLGYFKKLNS